MSQVDFVNYVPVMFWFIILFLIFYYLNFTRVIPLIYSSIFIRKSYYEELMKKFLSLHNLTLVFWYSFTFEKGKNFSEIITNFLKSYNFKIYNFFLKKITIFFKKK